MDKSVLEQIPLPQVENHYNMTSTSAQYPGHRNSGPVPNIGDAPTNAWSTRPFSLYDSRGPIFGEDTRRDMVGHLHTETPLNRVFFSSANIDSLQQKIQDQVFLMSGSKHRIDRQSDDDLVIIMRSYYLMFGRNNNAQVAEELADLNSRVVGYASAKIYSELDFYLFYREDIANFAPPIARPVNTQVYGTRYGELKSFF
jgi:hypothetical protein